MHQHVLNAHQFATQFLSRQMANRRPKKTVEQRLRTLETRPGTSQQSTSPRKPEPFAVPTAGELSPKNQRLNAMLSAPLPSQQAAKKKPTWDDRL